MSKLKNIKAIGQMLDGTHRTQNRKTFGYSDAEALANKNKRREIGEIWTETDIHGNTIWWEQKNGYRAKYNTDPSVSNLLSDVRSYLKQFPNCQKEICTWKSLTRLDEIFRSKNGMCEDCTMSYETKLKISGKFNEYALNKMKANAEAFFKQADQEVLELKESLKNPITYVEDAEGGVETWSSSNVEAIINQIDNQYNNYKVSVMSKLKGDNSD